MSEEKRPDWMSSISAIVNPEDYLLGRKIDKTFELSKEEKAEQAREARYSLLANDELRLTGDPILDFERKKEQRKMEIIKNPIRLRQLRERILLEERKKGVTKELVNDSSNNVPRSSKRHSPDSRSSRHRVASSKRHRNDKPRDSSSSSSQSSSDSSSSSSSSSSGTSSSSSSPNQHSHRHSKSHSYRSHKNRNRSQSSKRLYRERSHKKDRRVDYSRSRSRHESMKDHSKDTCSSRRMSHSTGSTSKSSDRRDRER